MIYNLVEIKPLNHQQHRIVQKTNNGLRTGLLKVTVLLLLVYAVWFGLCLRDSHNRTRAIERSRPVLMLDVAAHAHNPPCNYTSFARQIKRSKLRYARLKSYDLLVDARRHVGSNRDLDGMRLIRDVLRNESMKSSRERHEWILWTSASTLVVDMSYDLPMERYMTWDLVMWANRMIGVWSGEPSRGLSTSVLLVRNSNWSRDFFDLLIDTAVNVTKGDVNAAFRRLFDTRIDILLRVYFEYAHRLTWSWLDSTVASSMVSYLWSPFIVDMQKCERVLCDRAQCHQSTCRHVWTNYVKYSNLFFMHQAEHINY